MKKNYFNKIYNVPMIKSTTKEKLNSRKNKN